MMNSISVDTNPLIRVEGVTRAYHLGTREVHALRGVDLSVLRGELVALRGRSGSGKTTLLNCIGGLDRPTSGQVWIEGREVTQLSEGDSVQLRRQRIGFVFQSFALLPIYSAAENIDLMLRLAGVHDRGERKRRVEYVLTLVGLKKWATHRPFELSGGMRQRVSFLRSAVGTRGLMLLDEPFGPLDPFSAHQLWDDLWARREQGKSVLLSSHQSPLNVRPDRYLILEGGDLVADGTPDYLKDALHADSNSLDDLLRATIEHIERQAPAQEA